MTNRVAMPCADKPNCVSTQDLRAQYNLAPFNLTDIANIDAIEAVAQTLKGVDTELKEPDYLHLTATSTIMRFVDDFELKIVDKQLWVRSESRVGHSDFGVNRKRADKLRKKLLAAGLITAK